MSSIRKIELNNDIEGQPVQHLCYYCNSPTGEISMDGRPVEIVNIVPRVAAVMNINPCRACRVAMQEYIVMAEIEDDSTQLCPKRTGKYYFVREADLQDVMKSPAVFHVLKERRFSVITKSSAAKLGLNSINQKPVEIIDDDTGKKKAGKKGRRASVLRLGKTPLAKGRPGKK